MTIERGKAEQSNQKYRGLSHVLNLNDKGQTEYPENLFFPKVLPKAETRVRTENEFITPIKDIN